MAIRNKILEFPNRELIHEQAAVWVARMDSGTLTHDEVRQLREWVAQSDAHKRVLLDTAKVWDRMDVMAGLSELLRLDSSPAGPKSGTGYFIPVAALGLVCLAAVLAVNEKKPVIPYDVGTRVVVNDISHRQLYETPVGGVDTVNLPDGSIIKLNTATRVAAHVSATRRDITLLQGEAYFDVARNAAVPFVVTVGETAVQALGTAFSVHKLPDRIEITVTEGLVQLKHQRNAHDGASPVHEPALLHAGQVAQVSEPGHHHVTEIKPREIARKLLWQQKMLAFDGNTLEQVINEFSRYTSFRLSIADEETAAIRVGGYFRSDDVAGLLTSLKENFDIAVEQTAANSFALRKQRN